VVVLKRGVGLAAAFAAVICLLSVTLKQLGHQTVLVSSSQPWTVGPHLILDAGHGGEDGGAVSVTGIPESQINLALVLKMDDLLGFYGVSPTLLRREDISLHDSTAVTLREKKVSDLKNRVAAIQETEQAVLLSIHQNSYPEERYHGTQTFYAPTEGSQQLAEHIQMTIREVLQSDNTRDAKKIPDTVYLMNHIDCPAVLVECGFLTNREEEALLREDTYQKKLAAVLTASWLTAPE
jgi:N-acetylmuramoyl-L-alanine amidase